MRAGSLRSRIEIRRITVTGQNSSGEDITSEASLGTYYAEVRALAGRQLEAARQLYAEARFQIRMRRDTAQNFQRKDKIYWGSRVLDLLDVEDPNQYQREIVMLAKEYVS